MQIKDHVFWITGGNSGMGEATARLFVELGGKVLLTARRKEQGEALAAELGENAIFVAADSKNYDELKAAAQVAVDKWGTIHGLVSSAGGSDAGGLLVTEDEAARAQLFKDMKHGLDLNLTGNFYAAQIAATIMAKNEPEGHYKEKGSIVIIASMASDMIWFGLPPDSPETRSWGAYGYGASKAGLLGLIRDLSYTLGNFGIRVNGVKPGYILTPMQTPEMREQSDQVVHIYQNFPKQGGEPEEVASLVRELTTNEFINAETIHITGGVDIGLLMAVMAMAPAMEQAAAAEE